MMSSWLRTFDKTFWKSESSWLWRQSSWRSWWSWFRMSKFKATRNVYFCWIFEINIYWGQFVSQEFRLYKYLSQNNMFEESLIRKEILGSICESSDGWRPNEDIIFAKVLAKDLLVQPLALLLFEMISELNLFDRHVAGVLALQRSKDFEFESCSYPKRCVEACEGSKRMQRRTWHCFVSIPLWSKCYK